MISNNTHNIQIGSARGSCSIGNRIKKNIRRKQIQRKNYEKDRKGKLSNGRIKKGKIWNGKWKHNKGRKLNSSQKTKHVYTKNTNKYNIQMIVRKLKIIKRALSYIHVWGTRNKTTKLLILNTSTPRSGLVGIAATPVFVSICHCYCSVWRVR